MDGAIARLVELGVLDDAAFGRAWLESRDRARPRGERALRQELLAKGLDRAVADELLESRRGGESESEAASTDPEAEAAARLLARHRSALDRIADVRLRRQRTYGLLVRNGFASELASRLASASSLEAD